MHIFIPSMSRWSEVSKGPLPRLPLDWRGETYYVVPPDQGMHYAQAVQSYQQGGVVLHCPEKGIARTRHWIGEYCRDHDIKKFIMMDDDVHFVRRINSEGWKLQVCEESEVFRMLDTIRCLLDEYGHVGIGTRQGNNNIEPGLAPMLTVNTRTLRCLAYRTADFLSVEHGRVEVMEDFDVNLQLLEKGIPNAAVNFWCQDQKMTNAPGGCSTYRTHEVHEASAYRLKQLHPDCVALVQKTNRTGGAFGIRIEVIVQWKKAYKKGLAAIGG